MSAFAAGARARWPWAGGGHGPLPALLVLLTVVTGVVDAVSYIALGHGFVANMTGNVVFLGFALAGASGLSALASLAALGAFLLGALAGGRIAVRSGSHRGRHLRAAMAAALASMLLGVLLAAIVGQPLSEGARYALIVPLAIAMGIQNATARRLAVPDLTTTVLTTTLTGIAADSRLAGGSGGHPAARLIAVTAMFAGALIGALLVINVDVVLPLAIAAVVIAANALAAHRLSDEDSDWTEPRGRTDDSHAAGEAAPGS
ncbi:MAG TPA: YoaK family protein [Solirubrobacteraceae bacterium]|nr:YoaK family protein [Solirubrobacteraceae bacterium]